MTRLPIILSAFAISLSLASSVQAYAFDPDDSMLSQTAMLTDTDMQSAETCVIKVTPTLAGIFGLDPDWRSDAASVDETALACAEQ